MKFPDSCIDALLLGIFALVVALNYKGMSLALLLTSVGAGMLTFAATNSLLYTTIAASGVLAIVAALMRAKEGFNSDTLNVREGPADIAALLKKVKASTYEGFNTNTQAPEISALLRQIKNSSIKEGFTNEVSQNIASNGYGNPGFGMRGPLVEGYEDVKKETNEKPAPALTQAQPQKDTLAVPFKLGEIPSQVKNGPHIDAGSTLIKAIQGLNPEQINAMTKDTQQLIETQKSLMGMLGTMKPMLNDGKQLMDTFQQMFGQ
jgi:hypothetical protein